MATISSKKTEEISYIAFFDLDRTIIKEVSGRSLAKGAWKRGLMKRSDLVHAIYLSAVYKLGVKDPLKIVNRMAGWVRGLSEATLENLCIEVFNDVLLPSLHPEAVAEIKMHKDKNAKVVILSSTLTPVCREAAAFLGMDDFLCSDLEIVDGYLTGLPSGRLCFGDEKLVRLRKYCELNNSNPDSAWYYADANTDIPALSIVGTPVCINPENKLARIARKKGWKIYNWK
jgi:HAD superfamily hydrolase (TIGR01490 family)